MIKLRFSLAFFLCIFQLLQAHIPTEQETALYRSQLDGLALD